MVVKCFSCTFLARWCTLFGWGLTQFSRQLFGVVCDWSIFGTFRYVVYFRLFFSPVRIKRMQVIFIRCTKTETDSRTVVRVNKLMYYMCVHTYTRCHRFQLTARYTTAHTCTHTESSLIQPVDMCTYVRLFLLLVFLSRSRVPFVSGRCSQAACHETYEHMSVHMHVHFGTLSAGTTHSTMCVCVSLVWYVNK